MIKGVHTMFYTSDAEATREFLRDKLQFPYTDVGGGWLIFDMPEADMGCHPSGGDHGDAPGTHAISFYCDNLEETMEELSGRGVEFEEVVEASFGLVTYFSMPGGVRLQLYQPKYKKG